jgi:hypothetical protein
MAGRRRASERWRWVVGDKGKKDKDKGQKQNLEKQKQKEKEKVAKQPKRAS